MSLNATQRASLLAYRTTLPKGNEPPALPTLSTRFNNLEGRELWREYAVLLQATPIKK